MVQLDPQACAIMIAAILLLLYTQETWNKRGYSCPNCGTRDAERHSPGCQWKRYYEDE